MVRGSDELEQVSQHGIYACEQYGWVRVWVCGCVGVWVCGCVGVCVWVCVLRWWKIIEYETRKKHWYRLSSLEKLYSLYHILAHSYCHMKDGRQLN